MIELTKRRIILLVVLVAVCLAGAAFLVLRFSNSQSHKYIYMFQAYVYPGHQDGVINPPEGYTGNWCTWYPNGQQRYAAGYRNGRVHGKAVSWYPDGGKHHEYSCINGKRNDTMTMWDKKGIIIQIQNYENGRLVSVEVPPDTRQNNNGETITAWACLVDDAFVLLTPKRCYIHYTEKPENAEAPVPRFSVTVGEKEFTIRPGDRIPEESTDTTVVYGLSMLDTYVLSETKVDVFGKITAMKRYEMTPARVREVIEEGAL